MYCAKGMETLIMRAVYRNNSFKEHDPIYHLGRRKIFFFLENTWQTDIFNATLMRIEKAVSTYPSKKLSAGRAHAGAPFSFHQRGSGFPSSS